MITLCSNVYGQNQTNEQKLPDEIIYVSNPNRGDDLCISEIERAKKDIANGKIVFTQQVGFLYGYIRYESELKQICKENGLEFDIELISDVQFDGETQGCYGYYMDKVIIEKYGLGFKEKIHLEADSLYFSLIQSENRLVDSFDCDKQPRLPNELSERDIYLLKVSDIDIQEKSGENGGWPFFDVGFIIEKDSTISSFYINNFVPQNEGNKKFKEELFSKVTEHIKQKYPIWIPGKIKNTPVRTNANARFFIEKKQ